VEKKQFSRMTTIPIVTSLQRTLQ